LEEGFLSISFRALCTFHGKLNLMHLFQLTRQLVDMDSTTGQEREAAEFVAGYLRGQGAEVSLEDAEPGRPNVFAAWGRPDVVLSTHLDTVPPFIPSSEDEEAIRGRGACDAKGILAAMVKAAERLRGEGRTNFGLLFLVGEERNSTGAQFANQRPRGSRFLIDGEPTENKLALGSKGALRVELEARGRMAHSAYPELGESAIDKLVTALVNLRAIDWPVDAVLGTSTCNTGTIAGGRAPNVIPDQARAELMIRTVGDSGPIRAALERAVTGLCQVRYVLDMPAIRLGALEGFPTTVVSFTTDIPSLTAWGKPYLLGPGSISVAHTEREYVYKRELEEAVVLYADMVKRLGGT
jgi:acetylornithine deacetylase